MIDIQEIDTASRIEQIKADTKKAEQLSSDISRILEYDFKQLNRFNAKTKLDTLYDKLSLADAWLQQLGQRYNQNLEEIKAILDPKSLGDFPTEGNPYFNAMKEAKQAIDVANLQLTIMHIFIEAVMTALKALLTIIEQTKDVEIETIKMQQEEKLIDKVFLRFEKDLANRDAAFNKLVDNMDQWTLMVQSLVVQIKPLIPPEAFQKEVAAKEKPKSDKVKETSEDSSTDVYLIPEGQLTSEDEAKLKNMTKAEGVDYLDKKYSHWKTVTIAKIVGTDPTYVSTLRRRKI